MKKILLGVATVVLVIGLFGCAKGNINTTDEKESDSGLEMEGDTYTSDQTLLYYGCPNSKRINKLNTNKIRFRYFLGDK